MARHIFWMFFVYYCIAFVDIVGGLFFPTGQLFISSLPVLLSILLLVPFYIWQSNHRKTHALSDKLSEKSLGQTALRVLMLLVMAMSVRIPSVLLLNQPYEKTPLIYLVIMMILLVERTELSRYGFKTENLGKALACGVVFFVFWGGSFLLSQYVVAYAFTGRLLVGGFDIVSSLMVLPFMMLCVGVSEEGFFRGYIQTSLGKVLSSRAAILTQGVLFGLWHFVWDLRPFNPLAMLSYVAATFAIGLSFGYFYEKNKNLVPLVLAHGLWNSIMPWISGSEQIAELLSSSPILNQLAIFAIPYAVSLLATFLFSKYFARQT